MKFKEDDNLFALANIDVGKAYPQNCGFVGLAYQGKKDIVFRFIIEYSSLRDFELARITYIYWPID
jgi:hypothetical protein